MMALLLGLLRTDLLANDISAVTRVMDILQNGAKEHTDSCPPHDQNTSKHSATEIHHSAKLKSKSSGVQNMTFAKLSNADVSYLPSNLCLRKSNSAFCIMSVTCTQKQKDAKKKEFRFKCPLFLELHFVTYFTVIFPVVVCL